MRLVRRLLFQLLFSMAISSFAFSVISASANEQVPKNSARNQVVSIQAFTDMGFYGQKLAQVVITYLSGTDLNWVDPSGSSYTLWDRGSANPSFGPVKIESAEVSGNTVTLSVTRDTEATSERSRNTLGAMTTGPWYIDKNGKIHYGKEPGIAADPLTGIPFSANISNKGYFTRKNLDLVLCHGEESIAEGLKLTDGVGNYTFKDRWLETVARNGHPFETVYLDVNETVAKNTGENYTAEGYKAFNGHVPVAVALPPEYTPSRKYPLVLYVCGGGTSYWELYGENEDVIAHNPGTNVYYDNALFSWLDKNVIAASPHVHSGANTVAAHEVAAVIELLSEKYSVDPSQIIFMTIKLSQG